MLKESPLMRSFHFTMDEEGGETYTNDPRDPGGPTKYGVALNFNLGTIPDKNGDGKITALDVRMLEEADALVIYRDRYWRPGKCDALPDALALAHADTLYNIGPGAAPRILQRAVNACGLGIAVDGKIGPATLTAIRHLEREGRLGDLLRAQAAQPVLLQDAAGLARLWPWLAGPHTALFRRLQGFSRCDAGSYG